MGTKNALEIIKRGVKNTPELEHAYLEEKLNSLIACKIMKCRKRKGLISKEFGAVNRH